MWSLFQFPVRPYAVRGECACTGVIGPWQEKIKWSLRFFLVWRFAPRALTLCGVLPHGFGMSVKPAPQWFSRSTTTTGPVKGIAQLVREATDGGRLIIETLVQIATGPDSSDRDKVSASSILLDRGFGRAVETSLTLSVDAGSSDALSALADAELERLAQTLAPSSVRPVVVLPASSLSPGLEALPDAPPEALEAPLRPLEPVTQPNPPVTTTPVAPLPAPVQARRRRIVVPRPPVAGPVATVDGPDGLDRSDVD